MSRLACGAPILLTVAILVVLLIPLVAHSWLGTYSRYIADDFCTAGMLRRYGFWGSQAYWYTSWSGRFAFTFAVTITHLAGTSLTPYLPSLAVALWLVTLLVFAGKWTRVIGAAPPRAGVVALAITPLHLALVGTPNPYQSLYWQTGMLTYAFPLILGTFHLWWIMGVLVREDQARQLRTWEVLASGLFAFVAGGFSETYVSLQTAGLAACLALVLAFLRGPQRRRASRFLIAGLIGSAVAMTAIVLAPGSDIRLSLMPPPPGLLTLASNTLRDAWIFLYRVAKYQTLLLTLAILIPGWLGYQAGVEGRSKVNWRDRQVWLRLLGLPLVTALLLLVPFAPSEYAISSYPDERVIITQEYILFLGITCWAYLAATLIGTLVQPRWAKGRAATAASGLAVLAIACASAWAALGPIRTNAPIAQSYALAWESRNRTLIEAVQDGSESLAIPSLRHMGGLAEVDPESDNWVNVCLSATYGLRSVTALP